MRDRLKAWLALFRQQPPGAQMAVAGMALLLAVLALSAIFEALQPAPALSPDPTPPPSVTSTSLSSSQPAGPAEPAGLVDPASPVAGPAQPRAENLAPGATDPLSRPATSAPLVSTRSLPFESDTATGQTALDPAQALPRLVIILDDIGYSAEAGQRALDLPGAITYAVLPFTPHGRWLAEEAHRRQRDVMLHAPMSNLAGMELGAGGLTMDMDEMTLRATLRAGIADIPHVQGVNNHTGSELTTHREPMEWVMKELKEQNLFFVDSLTHSASVAGKVALEHDIPTLKRHIFLDNVAEADAIAREFRRAVEIARRDGVAVAIGHPYPATLEFLERALPALEQEGIRLVPVSEMLSL